MVIISGDPPCASYMVATREEGSEEKWPFSGRVAFCRRPGVSHALVVDVRESTLVPCSSVARFAAKADECVGMLVLEPGVFGVIHCPCEKNV